MNCDNCIDYILKLVYLELNKWDENCMHLKDKYKESELKDIELEDIDLKSELSDFEEISIISNEDDDFVFINYE